MNSWEGEGKGRGRGGEGRGGEGEGRGGEGKGRGGEQRKQGKYSILGLFAQGGSTLTVQGQASEATYSNIAWIEWTRVLLHVAAQVCLLCGGDTWSSDRPVTHHVTCM